MTLPTGWPRIAIYTGLIFLLAGGIVYAVPQVKSAVVNYLLADREADLRKRIEEKLQPQIDQATKDADASKREADEWRKRAAVLGTEVAKLSKERTALQAQVQQAGVAVQQAREDATHVADVDLLPRIRASLGRLRTIPASSGGSTSCPVGS